MSYPYPSAVGKPFDQDVANATSMDPDDLLAEVNKRIGHLPQAERTQEMIAGTILAIMGERYHACLADKLSKN